jgi:exopolyphosphatase/guanosine-5'-triphosphate,3'-diphosphate pyrophosphatase
MNHGRWSDGETPVLQDGVCKANGGGNGRDAARAPVFAALDLGTNNCRMLIARPNGGDFHVVDSFSRVTRLGEGLSRAGALSPDAMDRTVEALKRCAEKMHRRNVAVSRHVATEACRRAANCQEFLDRVRRECGIALEIISAREEATLALKGCAALLSHQVPHALLFDIGGGSTEVLYVKVPGDGSLSVVDCVSLPMGVVTVAEDCGGGDLCERTYNEVADHVARMLEPFEARHGLRRVIADGCAQMIGTSGTVTTLGGLALGLTRYDRTAVDGITLDFDTLLGKSRALCKMSLHQRAAEPCIGWQRADLVLAGCAILEAICRAWPVGKLRVADRGLREGLLMEMIHPSRLRVETAMAGASA